MKRIDEGYALLRGGCFYKMIHENERNFRLDARVAVCVSSWENQVVEGYAVDFDEHGALVIRRDNGFIEKIVSGHLDERR